MGPCIGTRWTQRARCKRLAVETRSASPWWYSSNISGALCSRPPQRCFRCPHLLLCATLRVTMAYTPFLYRLSRSSASLDSLSSCLSTFGRHAVDLCSQARLKSSSNSNDGERENDGVDASAPSIHGFCTICSATKLSGSDKVHCSKRLMGTPLAAWRRI